VISYIWYLHYLDNVHNAQCLNQVFAPVRLGKISPDIGHDYRHQRNAGLMPVLVQIECRYLKHVFGLFRQCGQHTIFKSGIPIGQNGKKYVWTSDMITGTRGMPVLVEIKW
jgi:hypothetical protein